MQNLFKEYEGVFDSEVEEKNFLKEKKGRVFGYSPFALQDAIGKKDVKRTWIEYQKLRLIGIGAEELIHNIISKIRDMTAITIGINIETLGLKDYPYNKSKIDARNWKKEELKNFYTKLIEIYHKSRMSIRLNNYSVGQGENLDIAIEKIILNI